MIKSLSLVLMGFLGAVSGFAIASLYESEPDLTMVHMEAKMYHELIDACLAGQTLYLNEKPMVCVPEKH